MKHLKCFEDYSEQIPKLMSAKEAAPFLMELSSEELSFNEFKEYLNEYYKIPNDYDLDIKSEYFRAIVSAIEGGSIEKFYNEYVKMFHPWKESDKLVNTNNKTGILD